MPPKKKSKTQSDTQPGVTRCHLSTYFANLPESASLLKNGHILHVYMSAESSRAQTERVLQSQFPTKHLPGSVLNSRIKSLVSRTLLKFKKLSNPKEFELFSGICNEAFNLGVLLPVEGEAVADDLHVPERTTDEVDIADENPPLPHLTNSPPPSVAVQQPTAADEVEIAEDAVDRTPTQALPRPTAAAKVDIAEDAGAENPSTTDHFSTPTPTDAIPQPIASISSVSRRSSQEVLTPRKEKLKKRLQFMSETKVKEADKFKSRIHVLKKKLKCPKRVVNQALKRKAEQLAVKNKKIAELQEKLAGKDLAIELAATNAELAQLKQAHSKLKKYNKKDNKKASAAASVPLHQHRKVQRKLEAENEDLRVQLQEEKLEKSDETVSCKKDNKTFNSKYRKCMYYCLLNQVPVEATGQLIHDIVEEMTGRKMDSVADPTTVSQCAYELGILTDIQVAEALELEDNVNIAWDATSLDAAHFNEIHINSCGVDGDSPRTLVLQVEILAGGTTADYVQHTCQAIRDITDSYAEFKQVDQIHFHQSVVSKLKSTLSDRVSVNHCVRVQLEENLNIDLLEIKCNVHPLDGLASEARKCLKSLDKESDFRGSVFGRDSATVNVIYGISKMRYKNGKGDPKGFKHFMKTNYVKSSLLVRYVGNRMHVLFHLAGSFYFLRENHATVRLVSEHHC